MRAPKTAAQGARDRRRCASYVGISDTPAWKVAQANTLAQLRGWTPFVGLSTQYSLVERTAERDLLPMCSDMNVGCVPWGVLSQGLLSGKYNHLSVQDGAEAQILMGPHLVGPH